MYVNEMQRSINGFGHARQAVPIPYSTWQPYQPGAIARPYGFGDVPNDFEASVDLQYIPVRQAWYYGTPVNGGGYPDAGLPRKNLGDAASEAAILQLAKTERLQTILQVISTVSIATMATLAVVRAIRSRRGGGDARFFGDDD
jgi:hypothetical protein